MSNNSMWSTIYSLWQLQVIYHQGWFNASPHLWMLVNVARRNVITAPMLEHFCSCVERFHELCNIFIQVGVSISLPCQHALSHYYYAIQLFSSPNGLCSSITESKHIKAVKEPWCRSSRFCVLIQMLQILVQMDKLAALHHIFSHMGMLAGSTSSHIASLEAVEQQNLHKAVACHTLSLPLLFTEVLVLQVLRTNPSEVY